MHLISLISKQMMSTVAVLGYDVYEHDDLAITITQSKSISTLSAALGTQITDKVFDTPMSITYASHAENNIYTSLDSVETIRSEIFLVKSYILLSHILK